MTIQTWLDVPIGTLLYAIPNLLFLLVRFQFIHKFATLASDNLFEGCS